MRQIEEGRRRARRRPFLFMPLASHSGKVAAEHYPDLEEMKPAMRATRNLGARNHDPGTIQRMPPPYPVDPDQHRLSSPVRAFLDRVARSWKRGNSHRFSCLAGNTRRSPRVTTSTGLLVEWGLTWRALKATCLCARVGAETRILDIMRLSATSSRRGAMRIAYYPSDFIGHELRYSCEKCRRSGSVAAADAVARYGNKGDAGASLRLREGARM